MSDSSANCPDRTKKHLLDLQSKYREVVIPTTKLTPAIQNVIVPSNPFRTMLSFSINATATVDVYFINQSGELVWWVQRGSIFNVTLNSQINYILPTFSWVAIPTNPDFLVGTTYVKT